MSLWCPCQCMFGIVTVPSKHLKLSLRFLIFCKYTSDIFRDTNVLFCSRTPDGFYLPFLLQNECDDDCIMSQKYRSTLHYLVCTKTHKHIRRVDVTVLYALKCLSERSISVENCRLRNDNKTLFAFKRTKTIHLKLTIPFPCKKTSIFSSNGQWKRFILPFLRRDSWEWNGNNFGLKDVEDFSER